MSESRAGARPQIPGYISAVSGATAGLIAGIAVCPLDVVKTRLQVLGSSRSARSGPLPGNVLQMLRHIFRSEGMRGLYSGLGPLCVGYLPSWGIYFYVYKTLQKYIIPAPQISERSDESATWAPLPNLLPAIGSAVLAGACSTVVTNPVWMIKTRMMTQSNTTTWRYTSVLDAACTIYRVEGPRAFYSGLSSALLGLPHVAIQFPLYERFKRMWAPQKQWYGILAASIGSKVVASTITYPHEVVRSRNQIRSEGTKYRGVLRTVRTLWIEEGWRAFYSGLTANVCRAIPSSAVTLLTFELVNASLTRTYLEQSTSLDSELVDPVCVKSENNSDALEHPVAVMPQNPVIDVESLDEEYS